MVGTIALFVLAGHIWSLGTGLYLDDHAHFEHLYRGDWSLRSAVEASRLGIVGEVMDLWGRREAGLLFFRPIAFWIMKIEYTAAAWQPAIMHLFSMLWHFGCCLLVAALAMRCLGRWFWATVAASLMAIHPGHMATVYWVACQTELITTTFLLIGILAYSRHAGWPQPLLTRHLGTDTRFRSTAPPARTITLSGLVAVLCYGLALGCRENAVLFPLVCWAGDRLFGSPRAGRLRWEYVCMGCLLALYLALRWHMLGGFPLPAKPYLMPVTDPEFPKFAIDKISIYLTALFLFVPVVPIGGRVFFSTRPLWLYGGLAVVALILVLIWLGYRRSRTLTWPMIWIGCFLAPVLPVFASSHHLYLPGVGMALLVGAGLAALRGAWSPSSRALQDSDGTIKEPRASARAAAQTSTAIPVLLTFFRIWASRFLLVTLALGLTTMTWCLGFAYARGTLVEDLLIDDVAHRGREISNGDHLFFINMPVLAYYAIPALRARLGLEELHGHVLTFAPDLLHMESPGRLDVLDAHQLRIRSARENRYLEGVTGQMLLGVMNLTDAARKRRQLDADLFTVTPTEVDEQGIRELLFEFKQRLDSPEYHFFFGSPQFMAYPITLADHSAINRQRPSRTTSGGGTTATTWH